MRKIREKDLNYEILKILSEGFGWVTLDTICIELKIVDDLLIKSLSILCSSNLIDVEKRGASSVYKINSAGMLALINIEGYKDSTNKAYLAIWISIISVIISILLGAISTYFAYRDYDGDKVWQEDQIKVLQQIELNTKNQVFIAPHPGLVPGSGELLGQVPE